MIPRIPASVRCLVFGLALAAVSPFASATPPVGEMPDQSRVLIELALPAEVAEIPEGTVLTLRSGDESREIAVTAPRLEVPLEDGPWRLTLAGPGLWHPEVVFAVPAEDESQPLVLEPLPAVAATGKLGFATPPDGEARLQARFSFPDRNREARWEHRADCETGPEQVFTCRLPRTAIDLRLQAPGWVPHYRWNVDLGTEGAASLGAFKMRRGGSILGRIETVAAAPDLGEARVTISPAQLSSSGGATARRVESTLMVAHPNERGYFQLDGLPPGRYAVEAHLEPFAPARVFPLDLPPGAEIRLPEPILLDMPLSLRFTVDPLLDWRDAPWRIQVLRSSFASSRFDAEPIYDGGFPEGGTLEIPGQSPGRYRIRLFDSEGGSFWQKPDLVVTSEADTQIDIALDFLLIEGRVTLGDEPLAARISFGGRKGEGQDLTTDEDGAFSVVLPHAGTWDIGVRADEPLLRASQQVTIPEEGRSPREVLLEIPDTLVYGKVVDAAGNPVPGAQIMTGAHDGGAQATADADGSFEARGMPEGPATLLASGRLPDGTSRESLASRVHLTEDQPTGPVVLELQEMKPIDGRVLGEMAPVSGAQVHLLPAQPGFGAVTETELDGSFVTELPSALEQLRVVVMPPGHALKAFEVDLRQGRSVAFKVPSQGGTVNLRMPYDQEGFAAQHLRFFFTQDGVPLAVHHLYHWSVSHGGIFGEELSTIPNLAPGHYKACIARLPTGLDPPDFSSCAEGMLSPGGTLDLMPPALDEEQASR